MYQGRFKSFPVQTDAHFLTACRYVERNALRANLVERAEDWRWSSVWRRERGTAQQQQILAEWPVPRPADWLQWLNQPQTAAEEQAMQLSLRRGRPFGDEAWQRQTAARLGLGITLRPQGRPRKSKPVANRAVAARRAAESDPV